MNYLEKALELDGMDDPLGASESYENAIVLDPVSVLARTNLVALYIACLEAGYSSHHQLTKEFIEKADRRTRELVEESRNLVGDCTEIDYWGRYYRFRVLGEDWDSVFPADYAKVATQSKSKAPYLALYLNSNQEKHREEVVALRESVREGKTQRDRELLSIAESALRSNSK